MRLIETRVSNTQIGFIRPNISKRISLKSMGIYWFLGIFWRFESVGIQRNQNKSKIKVPPRVHLSKLSLLGSYLYKPKINFFNHNGMALKLLKHKEDVKFGNSSDVFVCKTLFERMLNSQNDCSSFNKNYAFLIWSACYKVTNIFIPLEIKGKCGSSFNDFSATKNKYCF